uniref:F-box protein n=1 Tax=Nelumbo nucifera TaxID=4432 RepID=A0A822XP86_NELNU|nr:TPA_asm: hypothetical protein HUJ06_022966 [Nelumbo nucifera]
MRQVVRYFEGEISMPEDLSELSNHPPPWEVLLLVVYYLDPKTLAMASCRRLRSPSVPHISLDHLIFTVDIIHGDSNILTLAKSDSDLNNRWNGVFRIDIELHGDNRSMIEMSGEVRVTWTVVLKGWRGVFSMMDRKGKGRLVAAGKRWFSKELLSPGCCSNAVSSGLVAELGLEFSYASDGDEKRRVEKVNMGILTVVSWGYLGIGDGMRYLQHFLLPAVVWERNVKEGWER